MVKIKLTQRIYAAQGAAARDGGKNATVIDRRYRRILTAVVTDRFDRATFHRFLAKAFFFGRFRLFVNVGMTAVVVAFEIRGRGLSTQIAVDALFIDIKFTGCVLGIFVGDVGHNLLIEGAGS